MKINKDFVLRKETAGALIANIKNGRIYRLNNTAYEIILQIRTETNLGQIYAIISRKYDFNPEIKTQIDIFIKELKDRGVIFDK